MITSECEMPDAVMTASANALSRARARSAPEVSPDDLLAGALEAAGRLGVAVFGPLVLDLRDLPNGERGDDDGTEGPARPSYAASTAALFDRAARIAREDGEARVRLVHLLAAFGPDDSDLLGGLMEEHGFDETGWRAALAEWDDDARRRDGAASPDRKVLSVDEAAETIGVHAQTVRTYIRSGKLPAYRIAGERAIRIFASDLYGLLEPLEPD